MADKEVVGLIVLQNVRLSFPSLFDKDDYDRYGATFLFPKKGDTTAIYRKKRMPIMKAIKQARIEVLKAKCTNNWQEINKKIKPQNFCVQNGDSETYDGYEGQYYIKANARLQKPKIRGRDKRPLSEEDGFPLAGDYVNAIIVIYYQKAQQNKKTGEPMPHAIWAALHGVQFVKKGERFGNIVEVDDEFEDITDETDSIDGEDDSDDDDWDIPF